MERIELFDRYINYTLSHSETEDSEHINNSSLTIAKNEAFKHISSNRSLHICESKDFNFTSDNSTIFVSGSNDLGYNSNTLSDSEAAAFELQLENDENFASEFEIYLLTVRGICQEAEQDDIEFAYAMKNLTKEQMKAAIGKTSKPRQIKPSYLKQNMWWLTSMAAMFIMAIGICYSIYSSSQNKLCDIVYHYAYNPANLPRSNDSIYYETARYFNLNIMSLDEIKTELPKIKSYFDADEIDSQNWHIDGTTLAMAYLKLHRKSDAIKVLETLATNSSEPQEYKTLLNQLQ